MKLFRLFLLFLLFLTTSCNFLTKTRPYIFAKKFWEKGIDSVKCNACKIAIKTAARVGGQEKYEEAIAALAYKICKEKTEYTDMVCKNTVSEFAKVLWEAMNHGDLDPETICILAKACTDTRKTESNAAYAKRILADKPTTPRSLSSSEKTFKFVQMSDMHSDKDYKVVYS